MRGPLGCQGSARGLRPGDRADLRELSDNALLPEREQRALNLRFYGNLTQAEIGQRLGISQMHVSRLLARPLAYLRDQLSSEPDSDMTPQLPRSSHPLPYQPELTQQGAG